MTEKANRLLAILKQKAKKGLCVIGSHELADQLGISEKGVRVARAILYNSRKIDFGTQISQPGRGIKNWYRVLTPQKGVDTRTTHPRNINPNIYIYSSKREESKSSRVKDSKKRKVSDSKSAASLTAADELLTLDLASHILGVKIGFHSAYGRRARKFMRTRVKEGFTKDELVQACRYATREWENGNHWRPLRDILYVWGKGFQPILATKGEAGRYDKRQPEFAKGETREKWLEDIKRRTEDA